MKSWHPPLPSFNPFVIVFYFLFRRWGKRAAPAPVAKTNDYYYDVYGEPRRAYIEPEKAYADPGYEQPAKYVQLFSWSLAASILNCFYRISVKKLASTEFP